MKAQMEIVQLRKENQTLKTENSSLRSKVADLEATVRRLVQIIREKLPEVYAAITQPKRDRQQPPAEAEAQIKGFGTLKKGFWGILAETTGRETKVSCSVGVDGIAKNQSQGHKGGDFRQKILPVP